ncbi:MAG: methyltransferase domain-containing protein [Candidatus Omnitrophica bacterium]|nr:methyltransferase domain-containing protein [Candidatus Omnitrophota bacterium]
MREFSVLDGYPQPKARIVGKNIRTIKNKIIASYRDERYYDGDRNNGYGGYKYDGRWKDIVEKMSKEYRIDERSSLLQVGCEKGFLLHDFKEKFPGIKLSGYEMSEYAIAQAMPLIKGDIKLGEYEKLPYKDKEFDFVIAIGVVYTLTLRGAISCLKEIQRVGKGKSFITLGAYYNERGKRLFKDYWSVLGSTILHVDEWVEVLKEAKYTGDYSFTTAESLNLVEDIEISNNQG